jgi:hypothetical protein
MLTQTRALGNQTVAVRGFIDSTGVITGRPGTFVGPGTVALSTSDIGRTSWQPGYKIELGYRFDDGTTIYANWMQLIDAHYHAGASLVPQGFAGPRDQTATFLTSAVYNFPPQFAGPPQKTAFDLQAGAGVYNEYGIWNGSTVQDIKFTQRFSQAELGTRIPVLQTDYSRVYALAGGRYAWFFERFQWRTVSFAVDGTATPFDTANYTNTLSQRMYGPFVGCGHEVFLANQFSLSLDLTAGLLFSVAKERYKYKLGDSDYAVGPQSPPVATKGGGDYFDLVPNANGAVNLWWYPTEGVQIRVGYTAMTFFNTRYMDEPIGFNYGSIDPQYKTQVFRLLHGFNVGVGFFF